MHNITTQVDKVHLFFPENDLALARDLTNYTPPPAAARLRRAGEVLPLWYGDCGDSFIATGVNSAWLHRMRDSFGMDIGVYDYDARGKTAAPWGWSKASRRMYAQRGFEADALPDDECLNRIRELSHRRTAALIAWRLAEAGLPDMTPAAVECRTVDAIRRFVAEHGDSLLKLPWSSSGRGLVKVDGRTIDAKKGMIEGMIHRQGSVMAEAFYGKRADFAMLFNMSRGRCVYCGLSLFDTDRLGSYTGNTLAPQERLKEIIGHPALGRLACLLPQVLEDIIGTDYDGPLGVDMMTLADGRIDPAVELNLRMTMGHLCLRFYERYAEPGAEGVFTVVPAADAPAGMAPEIAGGRLRSGCLVLNPPGTDFRFAVALEKQK